MKRQLGGTALATAWLVVASVAASLASGPAPPSGGAAPKAETHVHPMTKAAPDAGPSQGKSMTIVGEVMDPACFLEAGAKSIGPGHYQCAMDCARSGQTLAIYDRANDRIYFVAGELPGRNPNAPLLPYVHQRVDVMGVVYHRAEAYGIAVITVTPHKDAPGEPSTPVRAAAPQTPVPSKAKPAGR